MGQVSKMSVEGVQSNCKVCTSASRRFVMPGTATVAGSLAPPLYPA
jgi:hypothetical protein